MNILILGGAGFVGLNLIYRCLEDKNNITVLDSLDPRFKNNSKQLEAVKSKIKFIKGDIRNSLLVENVVKNQDVIFNCAGQTSHPLSLKNPIFDAEINCIGNLTILEAVKKVNPQAKIIFTASSTSVGKAHHINIDENHVERPLDIYSANKGVAEKYYYIYYKVYGLKTLSLRFANLFGPYGKGSPDFGFINYFIYLASKNKEIAIYGSGNQVRNVMYIKDAVDLLYRAITAENLYGDTYFVAHRQHCSIKEIAKTVVKVFGKGKIIEKPWPLIRKSIEIGDVTIVGKKLLSKIKWKPQYNLEEGIKETKKIMENL